MDATAGMKEPETPTRWWKVPLYFGLWTLFAGVAIFYFLSMPDRPAYETDCVGPTGPTPCGGSKLAAPIAYAVLWVASAVLLVVFTVRDRRLKAQRHHDEDDRVIRS